MDCGHFKKANVFLKSRYGDKGVIDWDLGNVNTKKSAENKPNEQVDKKGGKIDEPVVESVDAKDAAPDGKAPGQAVDGGGGAAAVVAGSKAAKAEGSKDNSVEG